MKNTFLKEGYPLFSPTHILMMAACAAAGTAMVQRFKKLDDRDRNNMLQRTAALPLCMEAVQDGILLLKKKMTADYLPLHLCGQAMFWEALHSRMKEGKAKKLTGEMIYSLFLPGAAMALVFPGWNNLPLLNPVSLKKYAAHFYLVMYGVLIYTNGEVSLDKKRMWIELAYLYSSALLLWNFNVRHNTNYLYTHVPVDPLAPFWHRFGKPAYIALMMTAGFVLVEFMYMADAINHKEREYEDSVCNQ